MARVFTQTLIRTTASSPSQSPTSLHSLLSQPHRFSTQSSKSQHTEVDLESETEVEVLGLRKLEDAIHSILVRQSAPDWLPFVPGSSYWVPPRRHRRDSQGIVRFLKKFTTKPLTVEESVSVSVSGSGSKRGWPSPAYFIEGTSAMHPVPIELEAEGVHSSEENMVDVKNEEE